MKTNVSRKTINTYIYLKKHVINNKSADKQVHMMKASNNKNLFKSYCGFCTFHLTTKEKNPNNRILQMWKYMNIYVPNNTHGKISKFSRNKRSDWGLRFYKHMRYYCFNKSIQTWPGNVSKLQLFIVMWYVELACCATFYAATKSHGKFCLTKGN